MRFLSVFTLALALTACAAKPPVPAVGPPLMAAPAAAKPVVADGAEARIEGLIMTAAEARAIAGSISRPVSSELEFLCWLAPAKGDAAGWEGAAADHFPPGHALVEGDLAALGVDRAKAFEVAEANLRAGLRPASVALRPIGEIGVDSGDFGEAGRIALSDEWRALAAASGGALLVAVPAADTILYATGNAPNALASLQARARAVMAQSVRPISAAVLRWTDQGWQPAVPSPGDAS